MRRLLIVNNETHIIEHIWEFTREEQEMPGYIESVASSYVGSQWSPLETEQAADMFAVGDYLPEGEDDQWWKPLPLDASWQSYLDSLPDSLTGDVVE